MFIKRKVLYTFDYTNIIMIEFEAVLRKWGRSLGMVIPNDIVIKEKLKEGGKVKVAIASKVNPVKETFGKVKLRKSTKQILKEIRKGAWDE